MGLSIGACKEKYSFLNNQTLFAGTAPLKDELMLKSGPNSFVVFEVESVNRQSRIYYQNSLQPMKEIQLYEWRNLTSKPIVKVNFIQLLPIKHPQYVSGFVYTEHFVETLSSIGQLNIEETLYLLRRTLMGYQAIFRILGYVCIDLACCGITQKGECKVWINSNFSKNSIDPRSITYNSEAEIVHQTLRMFRGITLPAYECFFIALEKHIELYTRPTFKEVDSFIQKYAEINLIKVARVLVIRPSMKSLRKNISSLKKWRTIKSQQAFKNSQSLHKPKGLSDLLNFNFHRERGTRDSCIETLATDRSSSKKRKSAFFNSNSGCIDRQIPQFLSKRNVKSPKLLKIYRNKQNSCCNKSTNSERKSEISTAISSNMYMTSQTKLKTQKKSSRRQSIDEMCQLSSINNILTEITENHQENTPQEDKPSNKVSRHHARKSENISMCHQFSINIINEKQIAYVEGRKLKTSNLSTNKSVADSKMSSPHKYSSSLLWDTRKRHEPYTSQFVQKIENFYIQSQPVRRPSGEKHYKFGNFGGIPFEKQQQIDFSGKQSEQDLRGLFSVKQSADFTAPSLQSCCTSRARNRMKNLEQEQSMNNMIKAKQDEIIMANSWKKAIESLVNGPEQTLCLNKSISYGDQIPSPPIRLDRLARIGRQVTQSIIPEDNKQ